MPTPISIKLDKKTTAPITQWLSQWKEGDQQAYKQVVDALYPEMKRLAASIVDRKSNAETWQPTELVHEVYIRISSLHNMTFESRMHFMAMMARTMRRVLVDQARYNKAVKRSHDPITLIDALDFNSRDPELILTLDKALDVLAKIQPRICSCVELHVFGGLPLREVAEFYDVSERTTLRDWSFAKAWIKEKLKS